ncbi:LPS export ABC transporter ATP-binding protein [Vampirovibrio chlorellavorus]|uniref:LPS export ABC transporter ATP-binding protein n=1 Tax=Vampirovibrio chlorellavorus TaxID=758823 RepID=UPI0026F02A98|nr:LPS export ABC transporter ATP-binding protein [Vampirovibrio chlorellavorus]
MPLIVEHLRKSYAGRPVVNDVSFDINPGEIVGLLGPNGAGKTTTFYSVVGIVKPDAGLVSLDGQVMSDLPIHERARAGIGYLPQETSVFRSLSVEENLALVLEFQPLTAKQRQQRIDTLLEEFSISKLRSASVISLSGGERRRVEIARAIATNPKYLLLDEPFTGIDPIAIQDIQKLIVLLKERGLGVLLTDHNPRATLSVVDRANIIHDGRLIFSGTNVEVAQNDMVRRTYLGEDFSL